MKKTLKQGFTLIELLVVIAILGIIAVGLLVALDPLEQTNRATDAAKRTLASDLVNTASRFYASKQYSAACPDAACAAFLNSLAVGGPAVAVSTLSTVNTNMNTSGDAKSTNSFTQHPQATLTYASLANSSGTNAQATFVVCWQPQSKAERSKQTAADRTQTVWTNVGAACVPNATNSNCYQCMWQ